MSRDPFPTRSTTGQGSEERESIDDRSVPSRDSRRNPERDLRDHEIETVQPGHRGMRHKPENEESPRAYYLRDRTYLLRDSELTTMIEIGTFRIVNADDLAEFSYGGDSERMNRELRRLVHEGLVAEKPLRNERGAAKRLLVLTKKGKRLILASGQLPEGQSVYHGLVKPREAKHDAALYRLYQKESARIEHAGGRTVRVALDYELKRNLQRDLAALGEGGRTRESRERVAAKHGLVLVNDKVQVPDLRLEYETAEMEQRHVDLELATRNYRPRALAQKAKAGFSLYAPREDASKLRRVLDEAELTARILSL